MDNEDLSRIQKTAVALGEHFDSVQIIVTRHAPHEGGTVITHAGVGNWYARMGSVEAWLLHNNESIRLDEAQARRKTDESDNTNG